MRLSLPSSTYPDSIKVAGFWEQLQQRVAALPGVRAAGAVRLLPLAEEMGDWGLRVEGYTPPPNQGTPGDWQVVTPGFFEAMRLHLLEGRFLDARDGFSAPLSMVINRQFAKQYFAGRPPLGSRVRIGGSPDSLQYTVVGIVDDVRHNGLTREVKPQFYATLAQFATAPGRTRRTMSLVVRVDGNADALTVPIRSLVRDMDPRLPVSDVRTMEDVLGGSIAGQRFAMQLLTAFGLLALLLSAIGVYGVVSQVVAARHQEFGIRAALGATPRHLIRLSLGTGFRQTMLGITLGVAVALAATRLLRRLLEGVSATDPITFAAVIIVTAASALLATAVPARRAARANPGAILRAE
jgi:predicted permease